MKRREAGSFTTTVIETSYRENNKNLNILIMSFKGRVVFDVKDIKILIKY